jgi:competence protein ComEC
MIAFNQSPSGFFAAFFAVIIVFISANLYEHGIISEDFYLKVLSATQSGITESSETEVHFIDVGQAECILIKTPGKSVLIDAGNLGCEKKIENYLRTNGVYVIDLFIATHPHADHIGSASGIVERFPIGEVIIPKIPDEFLPTTSLYEDFLRTLSKKNCSVSYSETGKIFGLGGGAILEILGPEGYSGDNLNNYSVISKLTFGETSFLFTGDAEEEIELSLVSSGADISCTVLNSGHHGSSTSSSALFLKTANPVFAAISCGYNNDYGHPHRETISSFNDMKIKYFRTDYDGDIVFRTDGKTVTVSTRR